MALRALCMVCLAYAPRARADASTTAVAEKLFEDAKAAMAKDDYASACPKLAESHRLDPATGGTLLSLAVCHEKMGRTASAWAEFEEAVQLARRFGRPDRERFARERADTLRRSVSMLTLLVAHAGTAGFTITLDGVEIGQAAWGSIPIDPGDHTLKARASGKRPWSTRVIIGASRETPTIAVPILEDEPVAPPPTRPSLPRPTVEPPGGHSRRVAGFVIGGVGVAGVAVGSAFGLVALHLNDASKQNCDASSRMASASACGADTVGQRALVDANISNVGFGIGIAGLALGTYLVLTSPSPARSMTTARSIQLTPQVTSRGGSVGVAGVW